MKSSLPNQQRWRCYDMYSFEAKIVVLGAQGEWLLLAHVFCIIKYEHRNIAESSFGSFVGAQGSSSASPSVGDGNNVNVNDTCFSVLFTLALWNYALFSAPCSRVTGSPVSMGDPCH